ncbi:alkaline phosphatase D family protein [Prosthecobacter dejongeii]|uniref:Alkaline phosphatase D n=1 Tax=Prosthecobacter dejongeii TaxID=48465 RepID=A0A7W8DS46_9BACT|nr:alkaline phosphatase D family protein [Prosthecobacter dejongeii]MBB5039501.1 alkaline phosphatase D [Prosthecobacter dejongeii]
MRAQTSGEYVLQITPETGGETISVIAHAQPEHDLCLHWKIEGLAADTRYRYRILAGDRPLAAAKEQVLRTAPAVNRSSQVRLAISSCAREDAGSRAVWKRMAEEKVDAVILIGDTPYIDSTDLAIQTRRHQEFAAVPEYQELLRSRPCWWTWDDHDFGGNDTCGLLPGKENSRLAYTRYRPQASFGDGQEGIYTCFRYGPVEVFMLDARWFSMTAASYASPTKPTLLGQKQWQWLQEKLLASTAPFKLLACGMIWDDKENKELDDWGTYVHERKALEKFIGDHQIPGVIYIGGDIHASRVLKYPTQKTVGYDLIQFIASPIHSSTIAALNVYHPDLVRSAVEPHVFLIMDIDSNVTPPRLSAELVNKDGERVFTYQLSLSDLTPA